MKIWSSWRQSSSRGLGALLSAAAVGLALTAGCLNRPVIEQDPQTSNVFVDQIRQTAIDKIDLLFVIDNSISMADKQAILSVAVPGLVERLVNPDCVQEDEDGNVIARQPAGNDPNSPCSGDFLVEFDPVDDIHIGVVTSSLGGHGGDICSAQRTDWNETKNDRAHLLPTVRPDLPSADGTGFLAWDPDVITKDELKAQFTQHVTAAGEVGCGYEATLEAWYRFLIDPSPPQDMVVVDQSVAVPATDAAGNMIVDTVVLQQRQAFLRPDSLVAIIMLTDENDCSVVDGGIGWLTAYQTAPNGTFTMFAGTQACASNPNDKCCRSCGLAEGSPPDGCGALESDPGCTANNRHMPDGMDSANLRCWDQKRRFGWDLLYPTERYVRALRDPTVFDTHKCDENNNCQEVQNPLFDVRDASNPRDPSLVFLAGIVGVPWQDIASADSLADPTKLEYLTAAEMVQQGRWQVILGEAKPANPLAAESRAIDPLMWEQSEPRTGTQPITNEPLAPPDSTVPNANSVNGHEYINNDNSDLQYACIFPLEDVRDCSGGDTTQACDCTENDLPKNRPLCNPPGGGAAGTQQYFAKAYPGLRLLQTLRDFGDNSIVASICPKVATGNTADPSYGYNPAVAAIIDRLKEVLGGRCLPRQLVPDDQTGLVPCAVVEATLTENPCDPAKGRGEVPSKVIPAVHKQLESAGSCGGATGTACESYHLCEIKQLSGADQQACLTQREYLGNVPGYCYIDAGQDIGNPDLLQGCPETEQRKLQFVGDETPLSGSITFIACVGAAFTDENGDPTMQ